VLCGASQVEFSFPAGHHCRRETIAYQVDGRPSHVEEGIDAQYHCDASSGKLKVARVPERMTREARGTAATPLLVSIKVSIIGSCWASVR